MAMAAQHAYLVLPSAELKKHSDIKYYTLVTEPKSAFCLFFHILAYIISDKPYLIFLLALVFTLFKKELSTEHQYVNALHKLMIIAACYALIILSVLFAINFFDTTDFYGPGVTNKLLAEALLSF